MTEDYPIDELNRMAKDDQKWAKVRERIDIGKCDLMIGLSRPQAESLLHAIRLVNAVVDLTMTVRSADLVNLDSIGETLRKASQ